MSHLAASLFGMLLSVTPGTGLLLVIGPCLLRYHRTFSSFLVYSGLAIVLSFQFGTMKRGESTGALSPHGCYFLGALAGGLAGGLGASTGAVRSAITLSNSCTWRVKSSACAINSAASGALV